MRSPRYNRFGQSGRLAGNLAGPTLKLLYGCQRSSQVMVITSQRYQRLKQRCNSLYDWFNVRCRG